MNKMKAEDIAYWILLVLAVIIMIIMLVKAI